MKAHFVRDPADADIIARFGPIDGPGGVLALSELPCDAGENEQVEQLYDVGENWVYGMRRRGRGREKRFAFNSKQRKLGGRIVLPLVVVHELGHALGIPHGPDGNMMAPFYDPKIRGLGDWDKQQVRIRY